jgi:hypothetical protein
MFSKKNFPVCSQHCTVPAPSSIITSSRHHNTVGSPIWVSQKPIGKNTQTGYHPKKLISVSLKKIKQPKLTESQKPIGEKTQTGYHPNKLISVSLEKIKQPKLIESHKSIGKNTSWFEFPWRRLSHPNSKTLNGDGKCYLPSRIWVIAFVP